MVTKYGPHAVTPAGEERILRIIESPRTPNRTFLHLEKAIFENDEESYRYATPKIIEALAASAGLSEKSLKKIAAMSMVPPRSFDGSDAALEKTDYLDNYSAMLRRIATMNLVGRTGVARENINNYIAGITGRETTAERLNKIMDVSCYLAVSIPQYKREAATNGPHTNLKTLLDLASGRLEEGTIH